jgi:hypothetical protein
MQTQMKLDDVTPATGETNQPKTEAPPSKQEQRRKALSLVSNEDYQRLTATVGKMFDLEYRSVDAHPNNIKAVIKYKTFTFAAGISNTSKTFMILHSLGHYYFISSAKRLDNERYEYIYDKAGREAIALHLYGALGEEPHVVTSKMRRDRIDFEIGANNFGIELAKFIGMGHLAKVVSLYQAGDINYILDVTAGGKDAILPTDNDYLERYICNNLTYEEEPNDEKIFEKDRFRIEDVDWDYLEALKLEVHFF